MGLMLGEDESGWDSLETDWERFEFAQYIVNTPPEDRSEISDADAGAALAWMRKNQ